MGAFLDKPNVVKHYDEGKINNDLQFALCSMQGWRVEMEDAHYVNLHVENLPGWSFFSLFDGHAGDVVAINSAKMILNCILSTPEFKHITHEAAVLKHKIVNISNDNMRDSIMKGIRNGFLDIDNRLRELQEVKYLEDRSGATALCAFATPSHIFVANCGDSRAVIYNGKSDKAKVVLHTLDHKPTNAVERERIYNAGGTVLVQRVNGSLAVSRALGDFEYKNVLGKNQIEQLISPEPDIYYHIRSAEDQFLFMACDGIWDVMTNEQVCELVSNRMTVTSNLKDISSIMLDTCLSKGSRDNMSVIIIAFKGSPNVSQEAKIKDDQVNKVIESKVVDLLQIPMLDTTDIVQYLLSMLFMEKIVNLPPGGGIYSKREVIEKLVRKLGLITDDQV